MLKSPGTYKNYVLITIYLIGLFLFSQVARGQFLMDMIDTTKDLGKGVFSTYERFNHIRIGGYIQPQFQVASAEGAKNYSGGDFAPNSDNRFMLRRGRIRFDYGSYTKRDDPKLQFVFQFDGTERGVFIRDFWGRFWENKWRLFAFSTGMFARPFGYEVNLSSSDREAPERGRMSQILMKTERDIGFMASLEPRKRQGFMKYLKVDAGIFNGQGLTGPTDFDSYKDFIGQVMLRPVPVHHNLTLGGGVSFFWGGFRQSNPVAYRLQDKGGGLFLYVADSVTTVVGSKLPRNYGGVNAQLKWRHGWGATELRAEYWAGTQTALQNSSETPGSQVTLPNGLFQPNYIRQFDGAFIVLLQNIVTEKHQVGVKLDWYDPNTRVEAVHIGAPGSNLNAADIKYTTLGFGYLFYWDANFKLTLWYDRVWNEETQLTGYTSDISDNIFTARIQYRF
jgi:hypothetical protein